jgi:16S rRNA G966 N2-methylase RsmD
MPKTITQNTLFYGDNLHSAAYFCRPILREHFPDECIDLIYLDPPFTIKQDTADFLGALTFSRLVATM